MTDVGARAAQRRSSEQRLRTLGLEPVEINAPNVEPVRWGRTEDVLKRALCLIVVGMHGEGLDLDATLLQVHLWRLKNSLSPTERRALERGTLAYEFMVALSWQTEAAFALLWSLGMVDRLDEAWDPEFAPACRERLFASETFEDALALVCWRPAADVAGEGAFYERYYALYQRAVGQSSEALLPGDVPLLGDQPADVVASRWRAFRWLASAAAWDELADDARAPL